MHLSGTKYLDLNGLKASKRNYRGNLQLQLELRLGQDKWENIFTLGNGFLPPSDNGEPDGVLHEVNFVESEQDFKSHCNDEGFRSTYL